LSRRARRPPRGGRGLKQFLSPRLGHVRQSPPARGARIETCSALPEQRPRLVAPRAGGRIETFLAAEQYSNHALVAPPRGGRGLKQLYGQYRVERAYVAPPRGGRGLKPGTCKHSAQQQRRPPRGGRGLKPHQASLNSLNAPSPPARGARIENSLS